MDLLSLARDWGGGPFRPHLARKQCVLHGFQDSTSFDLSVVKERVAKSLGVCVPGLGYFSERLCVCMCVCAGRHGERERKDREGERGGETRRERETGGGREGICKQAAQKTPACFSTGRCLQVWGTEAFQIVGGELLRCLKGTPLPLPGKPSVPKTPAGGGAVAPASPRGSHRLPPQPGSRLPASG